MGKHWKNNGEVFFVVNLFVLEFVLNAPDIFFFFFSLRVLTRGHFEGKGFEPG